MLTIQIEVHGRVDASARVARKLSVRLQRLCLLGFETEAKVTGRSKVDAGVASAVRVEEVAVQEVGEILGRRWLSEQILLWRQLVEVRDVLGHVGPSLPFVGGHGRFFAIRTTMESSRW